MRFEFVAQGDVDPLRKQFLDLGDYRRVIEQVDAPPIVEVEKQIDIAVGTCSAARH